MEEMDKIKQKCKEQILEIQNSINKNLPNKILIEIDFSKNLTCGTDIIFLNEKENKKIFGVTGLELKIDTNENSKIKLKFLNDIIIGKEENLKN